MKPITFIIFYVWGASCQEFGTRNTNRRLPTAVPIPTTTPDIPVTTPDLPDIDTQEINNQLSPGAGRFVSVPVDIIQQILGALRYLRSESSVQQEWLDFQTKYNKTYGTPEEETFRREIFIENINKIRRFNEDYSSGKSTFVQQLNNYGDQLHHEFDAVLNGFNRTNDEARARQEFNPRSSTFIPAGNVQIPDSIDWRELGAVTAVRSQGICAGCYAFSAAGALEGQIFRKTGILEDISPQNLIDCSKDQGNMGCMGGLMTPAFQYVRENPGIDYENWYIYEGQEGQCRYKPEGFATEITGYISLPRGDEEYLKNAVATVGPISAAIDASLDSFQFYSEGVYFDPQCKNRTGDMNHAILIVGYGTEQNGMDYWLIKNSYGPEWGIGGYIKLARNRNNHCGIANIASYPLI